MKSILQKVNVTGASGTYPFGNIKDETTPGANDGTPIDVDTYADIHQFFEILRLAAGITANGLPDNGTNGFQTLQSLWEYLQAYCNKHLIPTLLGGYTTNDVVVLYQVDVTFPGALPGNGSYSGGAVFYNNKIYYVGADASVPVGVGETMVFDIEGDGTDGLYNSIILRGGASGSGIADYDASTVIRYNDNWIDVDGGVGFQNSWVNNGGSVQEVQYRKQANKISIRGVAKNGTLNAVIFTLPAGYRPQSETYKSTFYGSNPNGDVGAIKIETNGDVKIITFGAGVNNGFLPMDCEFYID